MLMFYLYFWIILFGACIGSFLNVVIYRLPRGIFLSEKRSCCPVCGKKLALRDLVPVAGYLLLKGRCRYCGGYVSPRYPLVEAACAILAAASFWRFGLDWRAPLAFGAAAILLAAAIIDRDVMEIPDQLIIALIPFAAAAAWLWPQVSPVERAIGFFAVSIPMLALALLINQAFGGGDIKLVAVCGFMLGWKCVLLSFFLALLTGGGYSAYLLASGKSGRGEHIAFGPHLCAGVCAALFFGEELIRLYLGIFA